MPDEASQDCLVCKSSFTKLKRRHHCRLCGQLVCGECSKNKKLVEAQNIRICDTCCSVGDNPDDGTEDGSQVVTFEDGDHPDSSTAKGVRDEHGNQRKGTTYNRTKQEQKDTKSSDTKEEEDSTTQQRAKFVEPEGTGTKDKSSRKATPWNPKVSNDPDFDGGPPSDKKEDERQSSKVKFTEDTLDPTPKDSIRKSSSRAGGENEKTTGVRFNGMSSNKETRNRLNTPWNPQQPRSKGAVDLEDDDSKTAVKFNEAAEEIGEGVGGEVQTVPRSRLNTPWNLQKQGDDDGKTKKKVQMNEGPVEEIGHAVGNESPVTSRKRLNTPFIKRRPEDDEVDLTKTED